MTVAHSLLSPHECHEIGFGTKPFGPVRAADAPCDGVVVADVPPSASLGVPWAAQAPTRRASTSPTATAAGRWRAIAGG